MTLYFRDEGQGEPVVLLHGLGASARVFDPLFDSRGQRRLISVDLPRTARSGAWAESTPDAIGTALLSFLDSRQVSTFQIFGHSFGGLVAMQMAVQAPSRIARLSLASTPALDVRPELQLLVQHRYAQKTMRLFGKMPVWQPALRAYLRLIWGTAAKPSQLQLEMYKEALSAPNFNEGMLEALKAISHYRAPIAQIAVLTIEKQVLWGDQDRLVSVVQGEQLAQAIGARFFVLPHVGHCLPEESPKALGGFLF